MKLMRVLLLLLVMLVVSLNGEAVNFGERIFKVASSSQCSDHNYQDVKNTGSQLFSKEANKGQSSLTSAISLRYYAPVSAKCFRAHPVFLKCVQTALTALKNENKRARVVEGYRLPSDVGSSTKEEDVFAASGTAVQLMPMSADAADLPNIARHVLRTCPAPLERIQRNIGVVVKSDSIHVYMGGPSDPPQFKLDGFTQLTSAQFSALALEAINEGLEVGKKVRKCDSLTKLSSGQSYPTSAGAEETVGHMDVPVTRGSSDFTKLAMYLGTSVQFISPEGSAAWCGSVTNACVHCTSGPVDATLAKRCMSRLMTPRMRDVLILLNKLAKDTLTDSLVVTQAWDEDYEGHVAASSALSPLHREGRAVLVKLSSGSGSNLDRLSQLAVCAGADFLQHNGDHLLIAVRKQHGDVASLVEFSQGGHLLRVDPPSSLSALFALPPGFPSDQAELYPILDSAGQEDVEIATGVPLKTFTSDQSRYLRINPYVADCFAQMQDYYTKRGQKVTLEVVRGFMTIDERDADLILSDNRYTSPNLGLSFEARARTDNASAEGAVTPADLARVAVTVCSPLFIQQDSSPGLGLYRDRLYVDMRDTFRFWNPAASHTAHVQEAASFKTYLQSLYNAAKDGRLVNPLDPTEAEALAEPALRQSVHYRWSPSERIVRQRADSSLAGKQCQPTSSTSFCSRSQAARAAEVTRAWQEARKMHNYHDPTETEQAFLNCFATCGTCTAGEIFESKLEHCSNYLHWSPFQMVPAGTPINFFPRERQEMRKCACRPGSHCVEHSALFLLLVNLFEGTYRADPKTSDTEDLYPQTENPSPVAELLNQLYATHHEGQAKVWVNNELDIVAMTETLEKLMLYNRNTTMVNFYVNTTGSPNSVEAVESKVQKLVEDWTQKGWPEVTREFVADFSVSPMEPHCKITSKRAARQHTEQDNIIAKFQSQGDRFITFDL